MDFLVLLTSSNFIKDSASLKNVPRSRMCPLGVLLETHDGVILLASAGVYSIFYSPSLEVTVTLTKTLTEA